MGKVIPALSLLGLAILFTFGLVNPASPVMWLASTSLGFAAVRFTLMLLLATLIITNPPRHTYVRVILSLFSVILVMWSLSATYQNHMKFLDTFAFIAAAITAGLAALELDEFEEVEETKQSSAAHHGKLAHS